MRVFENFMKRSSTDRLKDTGFLLKHSFKVVGKDKDIIRPTIHMILFSIILLTLFFVSMVSFFAGRYVGWGVFVLFLVIFVLLPFKFFYFIRQKANQSWIVYNTITGKDISYKDAHAHTRIKKSSLRKIALIEILVKYASSQRSGKGGFGAMLANLALAGLGEVWDLLSHYMIPSVVVEQRPLGQIISQLKSLRNNVPATLVGVFGIDFAGKVIHTVLLPLYLIAAAAGLGLGYLLVDALPGTVLAANGPNGFSFSWVPVFAVLYLVFILGSIMQNIVESIKVIYFTIFYTAIQSPMSITKDIRDELTHYLRMEGPSSLPVRTTHATQKQQYLQKLALHIDQWIKKGYSRKQIKDFLISKGHSSKDIDSALTSLKK